jgi:catechol 2,3-dioxygenase-like lactoylglutathione lyase family enzyme
MAVQQIKATRLSHVTYQHPNLQTALSFLNDFGLVEAGREGPRVFLRGYGVDPYIYVAEPSPDSKRHFLGAAWVVDSAEDLENAARHPASSGIHGIDGPGGGRMVTLKDPNGFNVSFLYGQTLQKADSNDTSYSREKTPGLTSNTAVEKPRRGQFRRFQLGPSPVNKLGHYGYFVPGSRYQKTLEWYTTVMNLKPTDAVYDPSTGDDKTVFTHIDLGEEFTDHHVCSSNVQYTMRMI